jgi:hypothetical protein
VSVNLAKPTDAPQHPTPPALLYVTLAQRPDGRVTSVAINDEAPDHEGLWLDEPRATVWTTPIPHKWDDDTATTAKVLDLALSPDYRDRDGHAWSEGERNATAFHHDQDDRRDFLRNVEAHIIRSGFLDAHTGIVACQTYGLLLAGSREHSVFKTYDGWRLATEDCTSFQWHETGPIAPANTSPRHLADAILVHLSNLGELDTAAIPPLRRIRVTYGLWRTTPHWANFKHRTRQRLNRYRHRITVRTR